MAEKTDFITAEELLRSLPADHTVNGDSTDAPKRGRPKGRVSALNKASLQSAFEFAAFGMSFTPYQPLTPEEIRALSDAWYEVLKLYPGAAKYLVLGNTFTAWGNALICTAMIVYRRVPQIAVENETGRTRDNSRNDGQRQDHSSAPSSVN